MIERNGWISFLIISNLLILIFLGALPASAQGLTQKQAGEQLAQEQKPAQRPQASDAMAAISRHSEQNNPDDPRAQDQGQTQHATPENDRLFGILPNYLTVENEAKVPSLTSKGKFKLVAKNAFDPAIYPFIGFLALISQAQDSEPEFGQGAAGYGRRYGAAFGDATIGSFMTGAVSPSIFKQDPRYFQLVRGGFKRRAFYSVSRIFVTRTDSGHNQFNSSEIFGNLVAAGISNVYHPAQDRGFVNTLSIWGSDTGWDAMSNLAQEFWPDVHRWLKRKFLHETQPQASSFDFSL